MKVLTIREAQGQLSKLLAEAASGNVIVLTDGDIQVTLTPCPTEEAPPTPDKVFDPEEDSPELEAELLKAIDGPFSPYSEKEMRALGERIIRQSPQQ